MSDAKKPGETEDGKEQSWRRQLKGWQQSCMSQA
jgi:hypothetical protein